MRISPRTTVLAATALAVVLVPSAHATAPDERAGAPRTVLDVRDLDLGAPPAVAWTERRAGRNVIHGPDGTTTPVPNNVVELAPMGSGYVVQTALNRPTTVRWVAADGTPARRAWRTGQGLAVSARGGAVAFAGRAGKVWSIDQEGDRVLRLASVPVTGTARAVAVTGESCKEGEAAGEGAGEGAGDPGVGCSIAVNGAHRAFRTTSHGIVEQVPRLRQVTTGRGRWIGGITSFSEMGSCSAMMRRQFLRWTTCDHQLSDIAPDNQHVLGTPAYADGFGPTTLEVLSTEDGTTTRRFTYARDGHSATYFDEVWEDAAHVLVVTYQDGAWAVVRLGVDGSMEYAVAPRPGTVDTRAPFHLQTR